MFSREHLLGFVRVYYWVSTIIIFSEENLFGFVSVVLDWYNQNHYSTIVIIMFGDFPRVRVSVFLGRYNNYYVLTGQLTHFCVSVLFGWYNNYVLSEKISRFCVSVLFGWYNNYILTKSLLIFV